MCGVTAKTSVNIELYALCLQTSGITSDPLKHSNFMNYSIRQPWRLETGSPISNGGSRENPASDFGGKQGS